MSSKTKQKCSIISQIINPKTVSMTVLTLGIAGLLALPSLAEIKLQINDFSLSSQDFNFGSIWSKMQSEFLANIDFDIPSLGQVGSSGLPDVIKVTEEIEEAEGHESWTKSHQFNRDFAEATSAETLSKAAEDKQKDIKVEVQKNVQQSFDDAYLAEQELITQNILKHLARQKARQNLVQGLIHNDIAELNKKQDISNRVLSNVSATLDKEQAYREQQQDSLTNTYLGLTPYLGLY